MLHQKSTVIQCLEEVGTFGRFQKLFCIIHVLNSMCSGYVTFQFQSLSVAPSVLCKSDECKAIKLDHTIENVDHKIICNLDRQSHWQFDDSKENLLTEFNLYCDRMYIVSAGTTVYFLGYFLSISILSSVVDSFGRKLTTASFILMYVMALVSQIVSTSIFQILIGRFILGAMHGGLSVSMHVMFFEFTSSSFATLITMVTGAAFSLGGGLVGLVAMGSSHWHTTLIPPILINSLLGILFLFMIPESPHWLFSKGHETEALASLNRVAHINGSPPLSNVQLVSVSGVESTAKQQSFGILFEVPFLKKSLACLAFVWFTVSLCYYGLEFNAGSLGDEYIVMIVMGCFDTPFKLYMYVFANKKGRQVSCQVYLSLALGCMILTGFPVTESIVVVGNLTLKTFLVACGRALTGSVFSMLYVYTTEILPTLVRTVGISFCSSAARIGSLLAPLVILVNEVSPLIIYGTIVLCLVLSMRLLKNIPETLGKPLPNNLQDCRELFDSKIPHIVKGLVV